MRNRYFVKLFVGVLLAAVLPAALFASEASEVSDKEAAGQFGYEVAAIGGGATGDFAPYLIGSLNHGKNPQKGTALLDAAFGRELDCSRRFSWSFKVEALAGYQSGNDYALWNDADKVWTSHYCPRPAVWLQQCYGELKYRGAFLTIGLKEHHSALLNQDLSSGDFVESGNARPIPEVRTGFIDFQNIPFTNGWVQIQGEFGYGKMTDNGYLRSHYNYRNYHLNLDPFYLYKRCYFRSKPSMPLCVTAGMQAGSFFGGHTDYYRAGTVYKQRSFSQSIGTFAKMLLPIGENGEEYYLGSTLGCWDFNMRYRLRCGDEIVAYFQWPWEDGSGIGKQNGFDGMWGLEYRTARLGWLDAVVVEYLDYRNQSGSIHWDPDDYPGTSITTRSTGEDNYYNNGYYNSYANYGMAIGSPVFKAPIYNLDGSLIFTCNRFSGFHVGAKGHISRPVAWRVLASHIRGLGRYAAPFYHPRSNTSMLFETAWDATRLLPGLNVKGQAAFDAGRLRGDNFGMMITLSYSGKL